MSIRVRRNPKKELSANDDSDKGKRKTIKLHAKGGVIGLPIGNSIAVRRAPVKRESASSSSLSSSKKESSSKRKRESNDDQEVEEEKPKKTNNRSKSSNASSSTGVYTTKDLLAGTGMFSPAARLERFEKNARRKSKTNTRWLFKGSSHNKRWNV